MEDESERLMKGLSCINYIRSSADSLIDLILKGLSIITFDEDDDNEDWGHSLSAAVCLQKLALLLKNDVLAKVVDFASKMTAEQDWKCNYAGLIALGCVAEGPDKNNFLGMVQQALEMFLKMFKNSHSKVREAISWVIARICEHHAEVFNVPNVASAFIPQLIESI